MKVKRNVWIGIVLLLLAGVVVVVVIKGNQPSTAGNGKTISAPFTEETARSLERSLLSQNRTEVESVLAEGLRTGKWPIAPQGARLEIDTKSFQSSEAYGRVDARADGVAVILHFEQSSDQWFVFAIEKRK